MKHRIVQFGDDTFVLQEKTFLFWYDMNDKYSNIPKSFKSLDNAKTILSFYLKARADDAQKQQEESYRRDNTKIHYL